jgi:hypothetical protein
MDKQSIIDLADLVEGVLVMNPRDDEGVTRVEEAYAYGDHVTASVVRWGERVSWIAEVAVLTDRMPCEVGSVGFRMSADGGKTWSKGRGRPPAEIRLLGDRMREHVLGLRNAARFATRAQGRDAIAALGALLDAVTSGDLDGIAETAERAQALLSQLTPEVREPLGRSPRG